MPTTVIPFPRLPDLVRPIPAEDTAFSRILCGSPIIGGFFSLFRDCVIKENIRQIDEVPTLLGMIDLRNRQLSADINRNVIDIALVTSAIALGVIDVSCVWVPTLIALNSLTLSYRIDENTEIRRVLQRTQDSDLKTEVW